MKGKNQKKRKRKILKKKRKNQKKNKDMFDALPEELQIEIFQKLPVKTLVCCICVCKSWKSTIKDPSFICNHLSKKNDNSQLTFCYRRCFRNRMESFPYAYNICIDDQDLNASKLINFPLKSNFRIVIDSINGLICVLGYVISKNFQYILWNPSIQRYIILPKPNIIPGHLDLVVFGYDSSTDDYKLVRMVTPNLSKPYRYLAEVFSLNAGSWKTVNKHVLPNCKSSITPGGQAFINGVIHWIATRGNGCNLLLAFDVKDETFHEIIPPGDFELGRSHLVVYNDSTIGLFCEDITKQFSFWIMKEYGVTSSWSKIFSTAGLPDYSFLYSRRLGYTREELFFHNIGEEIVSINLVNGKIIRRSSSLKPFYYSFIGTHKESLVLLNR